MNATLKALADAAADALAFPALLLYGIGRAVLGPGGNDRGKQSLCLLPALLAISLERLAELPDRRAPLRTVLGTTQDLVDSHAVLLAAHSHQIELAGDQFPALSNASTATTSLSWDSR